MFYIRELKARDLKKGFLACLEALSPVELTPEDAADIFRWRLDKGYRTFVAVLEDETIVGTATLVVERKFIHKGGIAGRIEDVAVKKDNQLQGIGTILIAHVNRVAASLGCYKITLSCEEKTAQFYANVGYRRYDVGMRQDLAGG